MYSYLKGRFHSQSFQLLKLRPSCDKTPKKTQCREGRYKGTIEMDYLYVGRMQMNPHQDSRENLGYRIEGLKAGCAFKCSHCTHGLLGHYSYEGYQHSYEGYQQVLVSHPGIQQPVQGKMSLTALTSDLLSFALELQYLMGFVCRPPCNSRAVLATYWTTHKRSRTRGQMIQSQSRTLEFKASVPNHAYSSSHLTYNDWQPQLTYTCACTCISPSIHVQLHPLNFQSTSHLLPY